MKSLLELRSHSKRKISNIWSSFLYIIWMIRFVRTMIGNFLIVFLPPRKRRNKLKKMNKNLTDLGLISMRQGIEHKISQGQSILIILSELKNYGNFKISMVGMSVVGFFHNHCYNPELNFQAVAFYTSKMFPASFSKCFFTFRIDHSESQICNQSKIEFCIPD